MITIGINNYFSKVNVLKYSLFLLAFISIYIYFSIRIDSSGYTKEAKQEFGFKYIESLLTEYIDYYGCIPFGRLPEELNKFFMEKYNTDKVSSERRISKDAWGNDLEYKVDNRIIVLTSFGPPDTAEKKGLRLHYVIDLSKGGWLSCKESK